MITQAAGCLNCPTVQRYHSSVSTTNTPSKGPNTTTLQTSRRFAPAMNIKSTTSKQLPTISDCESCGICCLNMGYPSYVTTSQSDTDQEGSDINEQAWVNMPSGLKQELLLYIQNYQTPPDGELDGPCVWYDTARRCCKHHEHRPQVCRDFSVGGKGCLEWRSHYRLHHPEYLP